VKDHHARGEHTLQSLQCELHDTEMALMKQYYGRNNCYVINSNYSPDVPHTLMGCYQLHISTCDKAHWVQQQSNLSGKFTLNTDKEHCSLATSVLIVTNCF